MASILIVDDAPGVRKFLKLLLGDEGHDLLEAGDGADALEQARSRNPELIIADLLMPNMDGYEFVRQLRRDPLLAETPVIFYTANYLDDGARELARAAGVAHVLSKPAEASEILATVNAVLSAPRDGVSSRPTETFRRHHLRLLTDKLHRKLGELEKEIAERKRTEQALHELSGRLLQLQDEERRRIARELHDQTSQGLAGLTLNLTALQRLAREIDPQARELLAESLALAQQCAREIRTVSYLLHPPLLDEVGLAGAMRDYTDGFGRRSGLRVELQLSENLGRLPREMEIALFRIVQESLSNIHRHSGSSTAVIRLKRTASEIELEVEDTGCGIQNANGAAADRPVAKLGVGIAGMRERLRQSGGRLEIQTGRNGTIVRAILPHRTSNPS